MSQAENSAFAVVPRVASQVADKPSRPRTRARRIGIEVVSEKLAVGCICPRVEPPDLFLERRGAGLRERFIVFDEFRDECHSGERTVRAFLDAPLHIFVLQSKTVTIDACRRLSGRDWKCLPLYGAGFGLRSGQRPSNASPRVKAEARSGW